MAREREMQAGWNDGRRMDDDDDVVRISAPDDAYLHPDHHLMDGFKVQPLPPPLPITLSQVCL